jgi:autotransporter-associated beta strand protein
MRQRNKAISAAVAAAFSSGILALGHSAMAQDVVWQGSSGAGNGSGSWNTATNWVGGAIPAAAATADFSQEDITATSTVTLDANQTIGDVTFGDSNTTTPAGWVVNTSTSAVSNSTDVLNLNPQGYNIFQVNQLGGSNVVTINAELSDSSAGNLELAKAGAGTLVLTGNNSALTGSVAVNNGTLELDFSHAWSPTTNILGDDGMGDTGGTHLELQGATLLLNGASGQTNSQTFSSGTGLGLGDSSIVLNQNGATSLSVNLGALSHNWASSLDVTLPTTGTVSMTFGAAGVQETFGTTTSTLGLLVDTGGMAFATVVRFQFLHPKHDHNPRWKC